MPTSLESARPIMAPSTRTSTRASVRYSVYSTAPTIQTTATNDSAVAEIQNIGESIERLDKGNKRLSEQRVELNTDQQTVFQKLALGAKLERALGRRMSGQDAVMRQRAPSKAGQKKGLSEKDGEKIAAAA
ncbi:hypothetical protein M406DRAFT_358595 [Cryphonectria parasitica EP155]|uniref:Uncharacterized protein n=1 Tax=Cryphonectria parasitica (strain ATCC 38755 / EP155) TaxID=660469 RepID=A0A9P4XT17_CRYP1|nr:uncharacterized protein M406DRAFT_358595 [Cryphonectria parasitica EP155]KAF3760331.1 hypothetical protein M406DRAFT_358595 [Cryphonectria parasitica EP155]